MAFVGIAIGISSTFFFSLGLFMKAIAVDLGLGRGTLSAVPLVITLITAALSPLVGRFVDRRGPMPVAIVSAAAFGAALLLLATFVHDRMSFFGLVLLLAVAGAGTIPLPFTRLIVGHFNAARGQALGIALAGTGVGAALVAALIGPAIELHGWREGYRLLGLGVLAGLGVILVLWFLPGNAARRDAHAEMPHAATVQDANPAVAALWEPKLLLLVAVFFLAAFGNLTLIVHFVPMLTDAGMTLARASALASGIGISLIVGRLVTGWLLDRVRAETLGASLFLMVAAGMFLLFVGGGRVALLAAILAGFGVGAEVDIMAFLIARHFVLARFGAVYGILYAAFLIGSSSGPAAAGFIYDLTGNYGLALAGAGVALVAAASLLQLLPSIGARKDADGRQDKQQPYR